VTYDDLIELARLCLLRASTAGTAAVADALRGMAEDYQARAAALKGEIGGGLPDVAEGALGSSAPEPSITVQQQQQPQLGSASADPQSPPSTPKRP
jgi:hypothetical protein